MDEHQHHSDLIKTIAGEYKEILANSSQGVYVYLDDVHKVCNPKFAELLGYASPEAWAKVGTNFPDTFVDERSQGALVTAYQEALENLSGSALDVTWKTKNGKTVSTHVILVPVPHRGHLFALHFVTES